MKTAKGNLISNFLIFIVVLKMSYNQMLFNNKKYLSPINRPAISLVLGKIYFCTKRHLSWYFSKTVFARERINNFDRYGYVAFHHQTPLLRKLSQLDMKLQYNKITNLRLAIERINGLVLRPGETFSFWRLIGRPTRGKGYLEGMVLSNGRVESGVGGGLCQLSNLVYWMTLHTPLTVVERWRHSHDVFPDNGRTQPFGSGATVSYNYIDLQIRNDTEQDFCLKLWLTEDNLCGELRSDQALNYNHLVIEKEHWITHQYPIGYIRNNKIYRQVYDLRGELREEQFITDNYAIMMYSPLLGETKPQVIAQ